MCESEISGLVEYENAHYTLGKYGDKGGDEVFYRLDQLQFTPAWNPDTAIYRPNSPVLKENREKGDDNEEYGKGRGLQDEELCVKVYVEVEKEVYDQRGDGTESWIESIFNEVSTLYENAN